MRALQVMNVRALGSWTTAPQLYMLDICIAFSEADFEKTPFARENCAKLVCGAVPTGPSDRPTKFVRKMCGAPKNVQRLCEICAGVHLHNSRRIKRRTNVQQLTCKIDSSNSFYYLFLSFIILELKPLVLKGKVRGEKL